MSSDESDNIENIEIVGGQKGTSQNPETHQKDEIPERPENSTPGIEEKIRHRDLIKRQISSGRRRFDKKWKNRNAKSLNASNRNSYKISTTIEKRAFTFKNGWTPELEVSCWKIAQESLTFKWLHNKNASKVADNMEHTSLAVAILSATTSGGGFIGVLTQIFSKISYVLIVSLIVVTVLSLISTIITLIQNTYSFVDKIKKHGNAEQKYQWLFYNIQSQLQLPIHNRQDGKTYFGWISHELGSISNIEDIDDSIIKLFYKTFPDGVIPGIDTLGDIELNTMEESKAPSEDSMTEDITSNQPTNRQTNQTKSHAVAKVRSMSSSLQQDLTKNINNNINNDDTNNNNNNNGDSITNKKIRRFKELRNAQLVSIISNPEPTKNPRDKYNNPEYGKLEYEIARGRAYEED